MRDWLGLEPAKDRNVRLWDGSAGSAPITPVAEVKNAATRADAARSMHFMVPVRKDLVTETEMPKGEIDTEKASRREALRNYLAKNGPTKRDALRDALGYSHDGAGRQRLNADIASIGAGSATRYGPVELPDSVGETPAPRRKPEPEAVVPVRPSLADAAREALRQADREGAPLYLEAEFASALHGRLVEAGL